MRDAGGRDDGVRASVVRDPLLRDAGSRVPAPIEATLEPPTERNSQDGGATGGHTVIINVEQHQQRKQDDGRYMMVRQADASTAHLLVCMGANVGFRYPVTNVDMVIGRSERCDIRIDDDRVSSRHAELVRRGARYRIYDLGSSNGTLVNAQRVDEIDLRDGDLIQIGYTVFKYLSGEQAERPTGNTNPGRTAPGRTVVDPEAHQHFEQVASKQNTMATIGRPPVGRTPQALIVPQSVLPVVPVTQPYGNGGLAPGAGGVGGLGAVRTRSDDDDDEVSITEMITQLRRVILFFWPYRWLVAGLALLGFVSGGVSAVAAPPRVAAFFEVSLQSKASDNPLDKVTNSNVEFFRSAATNFRSTGLIEKTLISLGTSRPAPGDVQAVQDSTAFVNISGSGNSQTYVGSYRGESAEKSLAFLEKHVQNYLDTEIDKTLKVIRASTEFLDKQLKDNESELKRTESALTEFKKKNIDGLPDQAKQYYDYLFDIHKKESDLAGEIARLEAEAAVDARRVAVESPLVESRVLATRPYQQAIVDVNRQLAEARSRGLADDHPDVRQLESKVAELRQLEKDAKASSDDTEVERSRNPIYESSMDRLQRLRASAAATHQERARLREDAERVKKIVDRLPQLEAQFADLTRSYDATKDLHTRLFDQLKTTQLQYELERASAAARYEIITAPRLEFISSVNTFIKRAAMAMLVGAAVGLAIAIALQLKKLAASWG